ncbi:unnamed protein product [Mytilus coruscus]|uniref:Uncharacterized protein n=1 Tax=Mytilus coruscus TaxID=42192 RepID=A0A6J8BW45_MYTCO|nr:unnamed protein product [Mytilus coruscus]
MNEETVDMNYLPFQSTTFSGSTDVNIGKSFANDNMHEDVFKELKKVRSSSISNLMCGYLNINSLSYKFEPIKNLLLRNLVVILFLSETKIDESFHNAQLCVNNFTTWRADRNQHGGGLIAYAGSALAADRKIQLEFSDVESIGIEVAIGKNKKNCSFVEYISLLVCQLTISKQILPKLLTKYDIYRTKFSGSKNWEAYIRQRNYVTKLKQISLLTNI